MMGVTKVDLGTHPQVNTIRTPFHMAQDGHQDAALEKCFAYDTSPHTIMRIRPSRQLGGNQFWGKLHRGLWSNSDNLGFLKKTNSNNFSRSVDLSRICWVHSLAHFHNLWKITGFRDTQIACYSIFADYHKLTTWLPTIGHCVVIPAKQQKSPSTIPWPLEICMHRQPPIHYCQGMPKKITRVGLLTCT